MPKSITEMCIIIKYIYIFVIYFNKIKKWNIRSSMQSIRNTRILFKKFLRKKKNKLKLCCKQKAGENDHQELKRISLKQIK